jgi:hypothetical protein
MEIGWKDAYDETRQYLEYLLAKAPPSPVKRSFEKLGIPDRMYLRDRWAGLYARD